MDPRLEPRVRDLVDQLAAGDFVDSHGHPVQQLAAFQAVREALGLAAFEGGPYEDLVADLDAKLARAKAADSTPQPAAPNSAE